MIEQFLTLRVGKQLFGVPIIKIRDVLKPQKLAFIPLVKPQILGLINLKGRIVTVIDMRKILEMEASAARPKQMHVVVKSGNELYGLVVDEVGDIKILSNDNFETNPENMSLQWKNISKGVFKFEKELMLVVDIDNLLKF